MKHSREKHDATSLVRRGGRYGHQVKESEDIEDTERRLHVHHCKGSGRSTQRSWGERRAHSCTVARRKKLCHREIGRHCQHVMVVLRRCRVLEEFAPCTAFASGGGEELVHRWGEARPPSEGTRCKRGPATNAPVLNGFQCSDASRGGLRRTNQIRR